MSTIDQRFSVFQTVMLQTVKEFVQSLVISTNQNNSNQPSLNTPSTNDQSISSPTHTQPNIIQPSPIIPSQSHLQYDQNTLNSPQLHSPPLLTPHQQQIAYVNTTQQFQINSTIPPYPQIHQVPQQHSNPHHSLTTSPIHHQHN